MRDNLLFLLMLWLLSGVTLAQQAVAKIELRTQPEDRRVRPWETAVIQLQALAEQTDSEGKKQQVRLKKNLENARIQETEGGWLSKPFLFQGNDVLNSELKGFDRLSSLLNTAETFVWQDSVLYTAPEKPGKYHVEVVLEGKKATTEIEVTPDAPTSKKAEKSSFPPEPASSDPYFPLVEHYAPFIAQETWFTPKADFITRFNFDGDWKGDDNWDDMEIGTSQAYVHYAVMETPTHWFLMYNLFHPRDYSDRCVAGTCHENDNEGIILTVAKNSSKFGRLQVMETLAHNNIYDFTNDKQVRKGIHGIDGGIVLVEDSHPVIFVESGGHGIYGSESSHARLQNKTEFTGGTGVTFKYKGVAERSRHANDREVGYALLPIYREWWERMKESDPTSRIMFDEFFKYTPLGNRPRASLSQISGAFLGRKEASNKARPFWGWFDVQTQKKKVLAHGQWGLDPAYSVSTNLRFPDGEPFSTDYLFNPYLAGSGEMPLEAASASGDRLTGGRESSDLSEKREDRRASPPPLPPPGEDSWGDKQTSRTDSSLPEIGYRKSSGFNDRRNSGSLGLRLSVDGQIVVSIQGDHIRYEVKNGRPPSDDGTEMSQPLPTFQLKKLDYEKKDGRGSVQILEKPEASNRYTLRLQIDDPKGGEDRYHIRLTWSR